MENQEALWQAMHGNESYVPSHKTMKSHVFTLNEATYIPDIDAVYSALIASLESHEVKPGVWDHVFSAPLNTGSITHIGLHSTIDALNALELTSANTPFFTVSSKMMHSIARLQSQGKRIKRQYKIKRRQIRAIQRRTRKGLA